MTDNEIMEVMAETKKEIERCKALSSPFFYDEIWDREVKEMCLFHPGIGGLPAGKFRELWDKAA